MNSPHSDLRFHGRKLISAAATFFLVGVLLSSITSMHAQEKPRLPEKFLDFFYAYCIECHDTDTAEGDFHLDFLKAVETPEDASYWQLTLDNLHLGDMPPEDENQPSLAEIEEITTWIEAGLERATKKLAGHTGEVVLRRLNRTEYEYTIQDLFDVRGEFAEGFPADAEADGFDNIGAALMLSAEQIDQYFNATDFILDRAIVTEDKPEAETVRFTLRDIREERGIGNGPYYPDYGEEDALISSNYLKPSTRRYFKVDEPGWYRFEVVAYAVRNDGEPVRLKVLYGAGGPNDIPSVADVIQVKESEPKTFEYKVYLQPRDQVWLEMLDGAGWTKAEEIPELESEAIAVRHLEMEGPIIEMWPPKGHQLLLGERGVDEINSSSIRPILEEMAPKLFRRPVPALTIDEFDDFYREVSKDATELEAFRLTVKAMMASPYFIYHVEPDGGPDQYGLANRLSYFLWRSVPDEELMSLASAGRLSNPETLAEQVERMLEDEKSERFLEDFVDQWLLVEKVGEMQPDSKLYPEYDEELERAMIMETRGFIREMIEEDEPLTNLIDSDWAYLNDHLAEHYGIEGVEGNGFRRVSLEGQDTIRGGLLTQASILNVTSNGTTTSPVVRGVFVLDHILGTPAPPPPPDVPPIEPDIRGASTIKEQLAKHREIAQCANCHKKIDPYGMAMENFDVIGGWRENYRALEPTRNPRHPKLVDGKPVDANDRLPRHGSFSDFEGFRDLLKKDERLVYENMAHKLAVFALGRKMDFADDKTLKKIAADTKRGGGGLRTMIRGLVTSEMFARP